MQVLVGAQSAAGFARMECPVTTKCFSLCVGELYIDIGTDLTGGR